MHTKWIPDIKKFEGPKYRALLRALKDAIHSGEIAAGQKLPPIREIAYCLKITPSTVVRAYQLGIDEGLLEARIGDGTYVKASQSRFQHQATNIKKFYDLPGGGYNLRTDAVPRCGQDELVVDLLSEILANGRLHISQYSNGPQTLSLKQHIATFLKSEKFKVEASDILITKGATNGSSLAAAIISHGRGLVKAIVDRESYIGFHDIATTGHVKFCPLEADQYGMIPDAIRKLCETQQPAFIVTSSICQNPYSHTISEERLREISAIAREFDLQIIDDVLQAHLVDGPWQSFKDFAPERTWTITSFAKLGYPALQMGVMIPPKTWYETAQNYLLSHGIRPNELSRPLVEHLLSSPRFYEILDKSRLEVKERHEIIHSYLEGFEYQMAEGSLYIWLKIPINWSVPSLVAELASHQILVASSDIFAIDPLHQPYAIRLTIGGGLSKSDFICAMTILRDVLMRKNLEVVV